MLGVDLPAESVYAGLLENYAQPHRAYHTLQHLEECFTLLSMVEARPHLAEISLALWFHDAIYDTRRFDNEARSADWIAEVAGQSGACSAVIVRLRGLIMATQHLAPAQSADAELMVDIDLAILGAPSHRFEEYEQQIRREYAWVPEHLYRQKRSELLRQFLDRPTLYSTAVFRARFEEPARRNLGRALQSLLAHP